MKTTLLNIYAKRNLLIGYIFAVGLLGYVGHSYVSENGPFFTTSLSESLDETVFKIDTSDKSLNRGDFVAFYVPENPFIGREQYVKKVVGVPGDEVRIIDRQIFVGSYNVGLAKTHSRAGQPLSLPEPGIIPDGFYFVAADHIDSFDSRYGEFGLISKYDVIGRAFPLL